MQAMLTEEQIDSIRPMMKTLRIIVFALVTGVLTFAAVVVIQKGATAFSPKLNLDTLPIIAFAMTAGGAMASFVIPPLMAKSGISTHNVPTMPDGTKLTPCQQAAQKLITSSIVACALLEGPAFFNLVVVFLDQGGLIHLLLAVALAMAMMIYFPFAEGAYVDRIERLLKDNDGTVPR